MSSTMYCARSLRIPTLSAWSWLSRAWGAASVVLRNRRLLFWKKLRSFVTIRNSVTGEITAKPLPQVEWIVFPFDTIVDEACRVAEAIQNNVDDWKAELRKSREALPEHATARRSCWPAPVGTLPSWSVVATRSSSTRGSPSLRTGSARR
jgi:hypothetical protein